MLKSDFPYDLPCGHYTLDQRRNGVKNNVTTLFQLYFNVVLTSDACWVQMCFIIIFPFMKKSLKKAECHFWSGRSQLCATVVIIYIHGYIQNI